jgi:hypothetical protein
MQFKLTFVDLLPLMSLPKALQERPLHRWRRLRLGCLHRAADMMQAEHRPSEHGIAAFVLNSEITRSTGTVCQSTAVIPKTYDTCFVACVTHHAEDTTYL